MSSAKILGMDYVLGGLGWPGKYGTEGRIYKLNGGSPPVEVLPDYLDSVVVTDQNGDPPYDFDVNWFNSAPMAVLEGGTTTRVWQVGGEYSGSILVRIACNDSNPHLLSYYNYDGNDGGWRNYSCRVLDYDSLSEIAPPLRTHAALPGYMYGVWGRVTYTGSIVLSLDNTGPDGVILSGVFFDPWSPSTLGLGALGSYVC